MAGPTTTGLAALIDGEDWHYVGETDEPAFENSWENVGSVGIPKMAFRIRLAEGAAAAGRDALVDLATFAEAEGAGSRVAGGDGTDEGERENDGGDESLHALMVRLSPSDCNSESFAVATIPQQRP